MISRFSEVILLAVLSLFLLSGCSTQQKNEKAIPLTPLASESAVEVPSDGSVVFYIPIAADPQGVVRIRAEGRKDMQLDQKTAARSDQLSDHLPVLHVKMEIENRSGDFFWNLDSRLQELKLGGNRTPLRPTFVHSAESGRVENEALPFVRIEKGEKQTVDFYYLIPAEIEAEDMQSIALSWQIAANGHLMSETARFSDPAGTDNSNQVSVSSISGTGSATGSATGPAPGSAAPNRSPASTPNRPMPQFRVQPDWWADPFADLPPTWRDLMRR